MDREGNTASLVDSIARALSVSGLVWTTDADTPLTYAARPVLLKSAQPIQLLRQLLTHRWRTTQRKPMWLVEVSIVSLCRAAGR
jgi:hypothetical protein